MQISDSGEQFIRAREGCRLNAYWDGGAWTIGYGNTYYENGQKVQPGDVITQARADALFKIIVSEFSRGVSGAVTSKLSQSQFDALVSYAYNRGLGKLKSSYLLVMVNQNPNNPAIRQQFAIEWGSNLQYKASLIKRRELEAAMYFSGYSASTQFKDFIKNNYLVLLLAFGLIVYKYRKQIINKISL